MGLCLQVLCHVQILNRFSSLPLSTPGMSVTSSLPAFHPLSRIWERRVIRLYDPSIRALLCLCCVCWRVFMILWRSHQSQAEITSLLLGVLNVQLVDVFSQLLAICAPQGSKWGLFGGTLGQICPTRIQLGNTQHAVFITCPLLVRWIEGDLAGSSQSSRR